MKEKLQYYSDHIYIWKQMIKLSSLWKLHALYKYCCNQHWHSDKVTQRKFLTEIFTVLQKMKLILHIKTHCTIQFSNVLKYDWHQNDKKCVLHFSQTAWTAQKTNETEAEVHDFEQGLAEVKNLVHAIMNIQDSKISGKFLQQLSIYQIL